MSLRLDSALLGRSRPPARGVSVRWPGRVGLLCSGSGEPRAAMRLTSGAVISLLGVVCVDAELDSSVWVNSVEVAVVCPGEDVDYWAVVGDGAAAEE